jgi:hypothetical protein
MGNRAAGTRLVIPICWFLDVTLMSDILFLFVVRVGGTDERIGSLTAA